MKAIAYLYDKENLWNFKFFPNKSIYSLPLAGKAIVGHLLDKLTENNIKDITIVDEIFDEKLNNYITTNYANYFENIVYKCKENEINSYKDLLDKDAILIWGNIIPTKIDQLMYKDKVLSLGCEALVFNSIQEYYNANFKVLKDYKNWVLPEYSAEESVFMGMNVALYKDCNVIPPVLIGDNVNLYDNCRLEGNVIVGENTIIDSNTLLKDTIVLPNTYIGCNLEFIGKIIDSGRIIDPCEQAYVELPNDGISRKLSKNTNIIKKIIKLFYSKGK